MAALPSGAATSHSGGDNRVEPKGHAHGLHGKDGFRRSLDAEARLGVRFPPWYRAFLALSNGTYAGEAGPSMLLDLGYEQEFTPAGLLPVQDVVRLEVGHPVLWRVFSPGRDWPPGHAPVQEPLKDGWPVMVVDTTPIRDALLISHVEQHATLMLVPVSGDWQVWKDEYTGPEAFASLASWLRWQLTGAFPK